MPGLAFVAAIAALMAFVRMRALSSASLGWPTVNGRITSSAVIEEWIEDKRSDNDNSNVNRKKIPRYQVDLRYAFRVGKRDFVGVNPNWGWTGVYGRRDTAEQEAGRYQQGQTVTVHYDPQHPANAVLEPSSQGGTFAPLVFGAIAAVVGSVLLWFFLAIGFS